MVSISQLELDEIDAKLREMRRVVSDCLVPKLGIDYVYFTNVSPSPEYLTDNYAVVATSEGTLEKYTLDRGKWKQHCVMHVEIQVSKNEIKQGERLSRSLRLLFTRSFSYNDTVITDTNSGDYVNDRGRLYTFTVEFNFIVGVPT